MNKYSVLFVYAVLVLSTLLVFCQVRNFDFINLDDDDYVYENPYVLNGLTQKGVIWAFTAGHAFNWHPLTWLSLMLDVQLFGFNPGWMHCVNVLLHLANTLLLFSILKKMTASLWSSAFAAIVFALHPMHVESVAWITERKDVLSTLFMLLTLASYVRYARRGGRSGYLLTLILFVLGLLAKPMYVTLPFLLVLLDYWPLARMDLHQILMVKRQSVFAPDQPRAGHCLILEKIPFFAISAVSCVITFIVQHRGGAVSDLNVFPLHVRFANVFLSYVQYIGKLFWPVNLAVFYPFKPDSFTFWRVAMCVLLLLVITILVMYCRTNQKYLPVGWFWFLGTLVPVIGFVQVGNQAYADRYSYMSHTGLLIMIAWGLPELFSKWPFRRIILGFGMAVISTALGTAAYIQIGYWSNSVSLFTRAIDVTTDNYLAYNNLGAAYGSLGRYQEAIDMLGQALKIKPHDAEAYNNLGAACDRLGRRQEAIEHFNYALKINPNYYRAYRNRGNTYVKLNLWPEAIEDFRRAVRLKPDDAETYKSLGDAYGKTGLWQEAIEAFKRAISIRPNDAEAYNNLGAAYNEIGRRQEALNAFSHAVRINPRLAEAHMNIGMVYSRAGHQQEAIDTYKRAIQINPDYAEAYYYLAEEFIMQNRHNEALDSYRAALRLRPDWPALMNNLALLIAIHPDIRNRDINEAIRLGERACEMTNYENPVFLGTLAAAYASAARFDEAVDLAKRALTLAESAGQTQIKNIIQHHLSFYEQGKPYIESTVQSPAESGK